MKIEYTYLIPLMTVGLSPLLRPKNYSTYPPLHENMSQNIHK